MIDRAKSKIEFTCPPASGLVMYFSRTSTWSGYSRIQCEDQVVEQNLYSKDPGWKPVHFVFDSERPWPVEIRAMEKADNRALASQVIFFESLVYTR